MYLNNVLLSNSVISSRLRHCDRTTPYFIARSANFVSIKCDEDFRNWVGPRADYLAPWSGIWSRWSYISYRRRWVLHKEAIVAMMTRGAVWHTFQKHNTDGSPVMSRSGRLQMLEQKQTKWHWLFTADTMVQFRVNSCEIRGGRSGIAAVFSEFLRFSPVNRHSTVAPDVPPR
jgi:hypothetical protein